MSILNNNIQILGWFSQIILTTFYQILGMLYMGESWHFYWSSIKSSTFLNVFLKKVIKINDVCILLSVCMKVRFFNFLYIWIMNADHCWTILGKVLWNCWLYYLIHLIWTFILFVNFVLRDFIYISFAVRLNGIFYFIIFCIPSKFMDFIQGWTFLQFGCFLFL